MKFTQRLYVPFNSYKVRLELDPGHRIAYYARSFDWIDAEPHEISPNIPQFDEQSVAGIFDRIDEVAETAECERRKMGCVVTDRNLAILSWGANVKPEGLKGDCRKIGCIPAVTCRLTVHAEVSALTQLSLEHPVNSILPRQEGLVLFNTAVPCLDCFKSIIINNVKTVIYKEERDQPEYDRPILSSLTLSGKIILIKVS
jgi:deoxycytidylate deaminase